MINILKNLYIAPKLLPWQMALIRRRFVAFVAVPFEISTVYFNTFAEVLTPESPKPMTKVISIQ